MALLTQGKKESKKSYWLISSSSLIVKLFFVVTTYQRRKDTKKTTFLSCPHSSHPWEVTGCLIILRKYLLLFFPLQMSIEVENLGYSFRNACGKGKKKLRFNLMRHYARGIFFFQDARDLKTLYDWEGRNAGRYETGWWMEQSFEGSVIEWGCEPKRRVWPWNGEEHHFPLEQESGMRGCKR